MIYVDPSGLIITSYTEEDNFTGLTTRWKSSYLPGKVFTSEEQAKKAEKPFITGENIRKFEAWKANVAKENNKAKENLDSLQRSLFEKLGPTEFAERMHLYNLGATWVFGPEYEEAANKYGLTLGMERSMDHMSVWAETRNPQGILITDESLYAQAIEEIKGQFIQDTFVVPLCLGVVAMAQIKLQSAKANKINVRDVLEYFEGEVNSETANGSARGWKVGDNIYAKTGKGTDPRWSTVRTRYWKNAAASNDAVRTWGENNVVRMKKGLAPQRFNAAKGGIESMDLSHEPTPFREGGRAVVPRWPQDHAEVDPYRRPGYYLWN